MVPHRTTGGRKVAAVTAAAALLATGLATIAPAAPALAAPGGERQAQYTAAAAEYGVPADILLGVSYLESRWRDHAGDPSTGAGFGPMHLTDAAAIALEEGTHHDDGTEDPRGDESRPYTPAEVTVDTPVEASLQTLDTAAALTGVDEQTLRTDAAQNIRGGAALLAEYQRQLNVHSTKVADWYGAVARYSGATDSGTATRFADDVFATIRTGAIESTDAGDVVLVATPDLAPSTSQLSALGLRAPEGTTQTDCPTVLGCEWIPAPYEEFGDGDYGNHDLGNRPENMSIDYIVIHDIEGSYAGAVKLVQDPTYVSWQYTMRSTDGHTAQHVKPKDVAWHAGNWYVNSHSLGIEHEGFAANGSWYTETLYRTSARLVAYLAHRFNIPLDRAHIIGHDNVPGINAAYIRGMHWDPGPYWDWSHYFDLMGAPFRTIGGTHSGMVTINPDYDRNRPAMYGCDSKQPTLPCPDRASSTVFLYSEPDFDSPLLYDAGLHPDGSRSTTRVNDHGSRVATGQRYAVADRSGDWLAIWYLGQKGWMYNPADNPVATPSVGFVVTPRYGKTNVPVYGRAYPEEAAYEGTGIPYQLISPLPYTFAQGERYSLADFSPETNYYRAVTYDEPGVVVNGNMRYYEIQFGHRVMYVNAEDVYVLPSPLFAP